MNKSRRAVIEIQAQVILDMMKSGRKFIEVESDIPQDAVVVGADYRAVTDTWLFGFTSDSLPEIEISHEIPRLDPPKVTII